MRRMPLLPTLALAALLAACGDIAQLPEAATVGPAPQLPPPNPGLLPTVQIAPAQGWPAGGQPSAAAGWRVTAFASGLDHPRWLHVLPNGDVLVAESNAPQPPQELRPRGLKAWATQQVMKRAGAGVPSADRITLLRDADGDGVAETRVGAAGQAALAVRHGPARRPAVRGQCRWRGALPLRRRPDPDHGGAADR